MAFRPQTTRSRKAVLTACLLAASLLAGSAPVAIAQPVLVSGFRALSGEQASRFALPPDVRQVLSLRLDRLDLTVERYQQYVGRQSVAVEGGQLTVVRRSGAPVLVVGAHYSGLSLGRLTVVGQHQAAQAAAADRSLRHDQAAADHWTGKEELQQRAGLWLNPTTGRAFYQVETRGLATRQFHKVDARTGAVIEAWDALSHDHGSGVKADRKSLVGAPGGSDNLSRRAGDSWRMRSVDRRLVTYDMASRWGGPLVVARDGDNHWTASSQRSAVDAQFYARATDQFLLDRFGFDVLSEACGYGQIRSVVRFGKSYGNAFWNGSQLVYGEGDALFRALSGAHDVVAHELAHAVTQCTSNLAYTKESGALNEAFSDIVAAAAEFDLAEPLSSNCRRAAGQAGCPDWWIGEDVWRGGGRLGLRSLADPEAGDQPAHYSTRYGGSADNGGVHINSGIPGHAFYLLSQGGQNGRCAGPNDPAADCDVTVPGVGLTSASAIAFLAYLSLPSNAQFCTARQATISAAEALHPGSTLHRAAAALSWSAVGVSECPPAAVDFDLVVAPRSLYIAPGGSAQLALNLWRGSELGPIDLSLDGLPSSWYELTADTLAVTLPAELESGEHPFTIVASSATRALRIHGVLVVDATPPAVSLSPAGLATGSVVPLDGSGLPVSLHWSAADALSGLAEARLEHSVDGGEWTEVAAAAQGKLRLSLGPGTHSFRVVAVDEVGNRTVGEAGAPVSVVGWQEDTAVYSAGWSTLAAEPAWGSQRTTAEAKRRASFMFEGDEVAWVAARGPNRGRARVYLDGVLVGRVDLYARRSSPRVVVFRAGGLTPGVEHSLRIVALGTAGRPTIGVDGFLVLSR